MTIHKENDEAKRQLYFNISLFQRYVQYFNNVTELLFILSQGQFLNQQELVGTVTFFYLPFINILVVQYVYMSMNTLC